MARLSASIVALLALFALVAVFSTAHAASVSVRAEETDDPEPSPEEDDNVCVDAAHLSAHQAADLVHLVAPLARVYCPPSFAGLPCATADHALRLPSGELTSYRAICEDAGPAKMDCERKTMRVNSVLSHRWTETKASGADVHLTMLDVRHPETLQFALHRLVAARRAVARAISL